MHSQITYCNHLVVSVIKCNVSVCACQAIFVIVIVMCGHASCRMFVHYIIIIFLLLALGCGVTAADTILLQPVMSRTSSCVVPMARMSRLTQSIHLCSGLPRFLLPGGKISTQSLSSCVFLVSPLDVSKPPQSCIHAPLCDVLYFKYLHAWSHRFSH